MSFARSRLCALDSAGRIEFASATSLKALSTRFLCPGRLTDKLRFFRVPRGGVSTLPAAWRYTSTALVPECLRIPDKYRDRCNFQSCSPAIGGGNDYVPANYDQRGRETVNGIMDLLRASGPIGDPAAKPDLGAYAVQQGDVVFSTDFEGCLKSRQETVYFVISQTLGDEPAFFFR